MKFVKTKIPDVLVIEPQVFRDGRGYFAEVYSQKAFVGAGIRTRFIQDNHSFSKRGVLRGMHGQKAPYAQAKLVRVVRGAAFDVAVDLRPGSKTYGKWVGEVLSDENKKMMFLPEGFVHGFLALEPETHVLYKINRPYSPKHEYGIRWDDPALKIKWPKTGTQYIISKKDRSLPFLSSIRHPSSTIHMGAFQS